MSRIIKLLFVFFILLIFVSCNRVNEPLKLIVPTPSTETGVVTGKMVSTTGAVVPENIFLSKNLTEGRTDVPPVISFSYQSDPRGVIDENGNFYFYDVQPGTYVISVWTPPNQTQFVSDQTGQDYLWVAVKAGELSDLGEINIPK